MLKENEFYRCCDCECKSERIHTDFQNGTLVLIWCSECNNSATGTKARMMHEQERDYIDFKDAGVPYATSPRDEPFDEPIKPEWEFSLEQRQD